MKESIQVKMLLPDRPVHLEGKQLDSLHLLVLSFIYDNTNHSVTQSDLTRYLGARKLGANKKNEILDFLKSLKLLRADIVFSCATLHTDDDVIRRRRKSLLLTLTTKGKNFMKQFIIPS